MTNKPIYNWQLWAKNIHVKIADIDEYRGHSLAYLGRIWGLSKATISRASRGHVCDLETVLTICFYLDMDINDFSNL